MKQTLVKRAQRKPTAFQRRVSTSLSSWSHDNDAVMVRPVALLVLTTRTAVSGASVVGVPPVMLMALIHWRIEIPRKYTLAGR